MCKKYIDTIQYHVLKMFGEKYIFKHVGEKMLENMQEICKNNTDSNLDTKVSTCLEDNWLNKIQNIDRRDFVFPRIHH